MMKSSCLLKVSQIAELISFHKQCQTGDISSIEFNKLLKEVEKYWKLKAGIRNQDKIKARQITKEQCGKLREDGRKEGKENLLQ